jgi:cytochrome c oxidase assembly factor CtaG
VQAAWAHPPGSVPPSPESAAAFGDLSWNLRPEVILPLLMAAGLYSVGCWRLSRRASTPIARTRVGFALGGLLAIALALVSPLDRHADRLFVAHMVQHMLLIAVAAPALLLADPFPIVVWALPRPARVRAGRWLRRASPFGRVWGSLTAMGVTWIGYALVLWGWHVPVAYDAALSDRLVHDVEHVTFFIGAVLFWWPVIHPAPRFRRPVPHALRIVYLVFGAFQTAALGLLLTLAPAVLYRSYAAAARLDRFGGLDDQAWGGVVMWGLGGLIDMIAVFVLLYRSFDRGGGDRPSALARHAVPEAVHGGSRRGTPSE